MSPSPPPAPHELAGFQRKYLRGKAHSLKPVVRVGESGISNAVVGAIRDALETHELVKVRLSEPEDKRAAAGELASRCEAVLCGVVGHTVILYRAHPDSPRIELPERPS